jgi:hypothetical protein
MTLTSWIFMEAPQSGSWRQPSSRSALAVEKKLRRPLRSPRIGPEMLRRLLGGEAIDGPGLGALIHHQVEAHASDAEVAVAAGEGVGLLLADPFRQRVRLLCVVRMRLVDRQVVEMRLAAEGQADRVDAGRLHDPGDADLDRRPHRVVAAGDVVVVDDMVGVVPRRRDGRHVDQGVAAAEGVDQPVVVADIGLDEADVLPRLGRRGAVDADHAMAAAQRRRRDGPADPAAAAGQRDGLDGLCGVHRPLPTHDP